MRMKAWTIVGYVFEADIWCETCIVEQMIASRGLSPAARDMSAEDALDQLAEACAIDRHDEWSFDSDEFPKVIIADQVGDDDTCSGCRGPLL